MNFIEEKIIGKGNIEKITLRFPPEPNGYLHLGHAKSICLNFGLAKKYNRPCNLRFDDTNPVTEKTDYVESIKNDIEWLGFTPSSVLYTSDYFSKLYEYANVLIRKGLAYVDDSTSEEIAELKGTPTSVGKDSPYKSRTIEENLDLFERMKNGEFKEGSKILRANIDMKSPNMILRDPVIYRIIEKPHHRTGDTWKVYPMYDFAHPLSDYTEGITDSLCTLEFEVHRPLYMWVLENCDLELPLPEETEFARLNVDYTIMSKRKLKRLVEENFVAGWDDPRMPTISGLRRRGYTPKSIIDFCETIGVTRKESVVSHLLLEDCLRQNLNIVADRYMGVMEPVKLTITNWDKDKEWVKIENNPEDPEDKREVEFTGNLWIESEDFSLNPDKKYNRLKLGGEVRLKGAYAVTATDYITNDNGDVIEIKCIYDPLSKSGMHLDRKIKGTIHWVSREYCENVEVREYSNLFESEDPDSLEEFTDGLNKSSLVVNNCAVFEPAVVGCTISKPVQMIRKGYYILDKDSTEDRLIFNKTVSLKEGYKITKGVL